MSAGLKSPRTAPVVHHTNHAAALRSTACAICGTAGNTTEVYPANFTPDDFNPAVFSARRLPDRLHYRLCKCQACGLVRSDPVAEDRVLNELYAQSTFDYGEEVYNLQQTYGHYLSKLRSWSKQPLDRLLEIGCGNGFVLEEAKRRGFKLVRGVEPSTAAVAAAAPTIRPALVCDIMRPGLFAPATFDAVCMFQVFDHLPDPAGVLRECFRVLRPGGLLLCLNHNVASWSAKLLKEKSPIVDIEHTYLYSPETMRKIVEQAGFQARKCAGVWNRYSLHYVTRLVPLPGMLKRAALAVLRATRIGRVPCYVRLGNLYLVAQKPAA